MFKKHKKTSLIKVVTWVFVVGMMFVSTNALTLYAEDGSEQPGGDTKTALTVKASDASKHIGADNPTFSYTITSGTLADGDTLTVTYATTATKDSAAGTYEIIPSVTVSASDKYTITAEKGTLTIIDHTVVTDAAVAATCTTAAKTQGSHCSVCGKVLVAQTESGTALGHSWPEKWKISKAATTTSVGKKYKKCQREGCNEKITETIPMLGTTDTVSGINGTVTKTVQVETGSLITNSYLGNTKEELLAASNIFTSEEKAKIKNNKSTGSVWLSIGTLDENSVSDTAKNTMLTAAKNAVGSSATLTYFDATLYKSVDSGMSTKITEPGINIKVTISIPKKLISSDNTIDRTYKVVRLHDGVATVLDGTYKSTTHEFTFETNQFSTYAITYVDTAATSTSTSTTTTGTVTQTTSTISTPISDTALATAGATSVASAVNVPKTGDESRVTVWIAFLICAVMIFTIVTRCRDD